MAFALIVLGNVYANTNDRRSRVLYEEALAIARDAGYKRRIAEALLSLGGLSSNEGKYVEAERQLNECLTLLTQLQEDESRDAAESLQFLGWIALNKGAWSMPSNCANALWRLNVPRRDAGGSSDC